MKTPENMESNENFKKLAQLVDLQHRAQMDVLKSIQKEQKEQAKKLLFANSNQTNARRTDQSFCARKNFL